MQKYKFFFHYNKPASLKAKSVKWSVHFRGTCCVVSGVHCKTSCYSKSNKKQPYAVMVGQASEIIVDNDIAIIN